MLAGVWAYAELTPCLDEWYAATARGAMTLPELTGLGMGWWAGAFAALLALGAWGMRLLERRHVEPTPGRTA